MDFRVITYNIRRSECDDGINKWKFRAPHAMKWLREQSPDVVGFQEAMDDVVADLKVNLPEYDWVGCGRWHRVDDEHCRIGWKNQSMACTQFETFWLSDTPTVPDTKFEGTKSYWTRTVTTATLCHRDTHRRFRVYNTHLDDACETARRKGVELMMERVTKDYEAEPLPFLIMGDFNLFPDNPIIAMVKELAPVQITDFSDVKNLPLNYTFQNYGDPNHFGKIDYIFGSPEWKFKKADLGTWTENGVYLSDHYPVVVDLELE